MTGTATARAHPNIALVKYWGKSDTELNLPATGSLSMTLDVFPTTTTVTLAPERRADSFTLNDVVQDGIPAARVTHLLDLVRAAAGSDVPAVVASRNTVPSAAGLASSASGFAALAAAAAAAYGVELDERGLSRLARRGSGSASRSVPGGFAVWHAGDDEHSVAERIDAPDLAMVIGIVERAEKPVSSREAMRRSALSSPFYPAWVSSTAQSLAAACEACRDGDAPRLGRIAETNALRMHAVIQACDPPIRYLSPGSVELFDRIAGLRDDGLEVFGTADAGPNVVAICRPEDIDAVSRAFADTAEVAVARSGPGVRLIGDPAQLPDAERP